MTHRTRFLFIAASMACLPARGQSASGPLVGHVSATEAAIWAYAGEGRPVEVRYGPEGASPAGWASQPMPPRADRNYTSLATLTGLRPATAYRYAIRVNGAVAGEGAFKTAPPEGHASRFSYLVASCMDYANPAYQASWDAAAAQRPAFNLFVGDNVYANSTDYGTLWNAHLAQRRVPGFAALLRSTPTYATWDDHDFGPNDSHGATPGKETSLRLFRDVWPNPAYGTAGQPGVFFSYAWGNARFIVLDGRYNRVDETAPLTPGKTQFGQAQLEWLFQQLKRSRAPFKVIANGYAFTSAKYLEDMRKIAAFIAANRIYGVVFHSGDIHRNDYRRQEAGMGYPFTEIISSGISRVVDRPFTVIDVNTALADPTLSARFFTREKQDSAVTLKLSDLTPPGTDDLLLASPMGGERYRAGERVAITWIKVGKGIDRVDLDILAGAGWEPLARSVPNTGSFAWTVPDRNATGAKVRIAVAGGPALSESSGTFTIESGTGAAARIGPPGSRGSRPRAFDAKGKADPRAGVILPASGRAKAQSP